MFLHHGDSTHTGGVRALADSQNIGAVRVDRHCGNNRLLSPVPLVEKARLTVAPPAGGCEPGVVCVAPDPASSGLRSRICGLRLCLRCRGAGVALESRPGPNNDVGYCRRGRRDYRHGHYYLGRLGAWLNGPCCTV